MEPNGIMYRQAETAYRTTYLTQQFQRHSLRARVEDGARHRRKSHLRWWPHHSNPS
jgi:hypothetical protein